MADNEESNKEEPPIVVEKMEQEAQQDVTVDVEKKEEDPTRAMIASQQAFTDHIAEEEKGSDLTCLNGMEASVEPQHGDPKRNSTTNPTAVPPAVEEPHHSDDNIATFHTGDAKKRHQNWDAWYEQMCEFKEKYGHCRPSEKENVKLSRWTYRQRYEYNQCLLQGHKQQAGGPVFADSSSSGMTAERMERLNQIGFEWSLTSVKGWDGMYQELVAHHAKHGHTNVPSLEDGRTPLSRWVYKQRYQYNRFCEAKRPCQLNDARIQLLNDLNFQWKGHDHSSKTSNTNTATTLPMAESSSLQEGLTDPKARWNLRYEELVQYKEEHGDCNVPDGYTANPSLGKWVGKQRNEYSLKQREKPSQLTELRIQILEELGFTWSRRVSRGWDVRLKQLEAFQSKFGHMNVPCSSGSANNDEELKALYKWVYKQRYEYAKFKKGTPNQLTQDRIQQLTDLGFIFSFHGLPSKTQRPSSSCNDDTALVEMRDGKMTPPSYTEKWMFRFQQLKSYKETHGDCLVPDGYAPNPALGKWVSKQRHEYSLEQQGRRSRLSTERTRLLEDLGFAWTVHPHHGWDAMYDQLVAFQEQFGHFHLTQGKKKDGMEALCRWVYKQRYEYKRYQDGTKPCQLTEQRIQTLNDLGFPWSKRDASASRNVASKDSKRTATNHNPSKKTTPVIPTDKTCGKRKQASETLASWNASDPSPERKRPTSTSRRSRRRT